MEDPDPEHASDHCGERSEHGDDSRVAGLLFGRPLDLYRASAASLDVLPGIGPARATAIVAERCRARFVDVADVERVHGIGAATRARIETRVQVDPAAAVSCPGPAAPAAGRTPRG